MCGIAAIFRTASESPQIEIDELKSMARALSPSSTEGAAYSVWDSFLGVAQANCGGNGIEPLYNKSGTIILVGDAKLIDRSMWLRKLSDLGYQFGPQTDNEIILFAYEEYGPKCFAEFSGMFAFILWDATRELLIAARDSQGLAPLYATEQHGRVYFASEIKSIFALKNLERKLNPRFFAESLLGAGHPNSTAFLGFISLRPGTYLTMVKSGKWDEHVFESKVDPQFTLATLKPATPPDPKTLTPEAITNNLHTLLWNLETPVDTVKALVMPNSRQTIQSNSPANTKSSTRYGISKRLLPYLLHKNLRNILPPRMEVLDIHDEALAGPPAMSWKALAATANGKIIFKNYFSLKALDESQLFSPFLTKVLLRLWRSSSLQSKKGRQLDALVGYILCCQMTHRLFLKYRFTPQPLHYWEEVKPDRHLPPRSELFKDEHPAARFWVIPSYLESKSLSDWDSFVLRHTHPGNFVLHFVSMLFFFGSPIVALVTREPLWLILFFISGMVGSVGHALFKDGKVSVREATIQIMVPYFVLRMFYLLLTGKYGLEIKKAQFACESALGPKSESKKP